MRTVREIIAHAGGATAIARRVSEETGAEMDSSTPSKWQANGIPDRYWSIIIDMAEASVEELFAANEALRAPSPAPHSPEGAAA